MEVGPRCRGLLSLNVLFAVLNREKTGLVRVPRRDELPFSVAS